MSYYLMKSLFITMPMVIWLLVSSFVRKSIVEGLTMGALKD